MPPVWRPLALPLGELSPQMTERVWQSFEWSLFGMAMVDPLRPSSSIPRGKVQEGDTPSWSPAQAPARICIIFPGGTPQGGLSCPSGVIHLLYAAKNPFPEATCKKDPAPVGPDPFCTQAECANHCAPRRWAGAPRQGKSKGGTKSPLYALTPYSMPRRTPRSRGICCGRRRCRSCRSSP